MFFALERLTAFVLVETHDMAWTLTLKSNGYIRWTDLKKSKFLRILEFYLKSTFSTFSASATQSVANTLVSGTGKKGAWFLSYIGNGCMERAQVRIQDFSEDFPININDMF